MTFLQDPIPTHLNGGLVIKFERHDETATVIVYRENHNHPFVVATWFPSCGLGWLRGNYCLTKSEAMEKFNSTTSKYL